MHEIQKDQAHVVMYTFIEFKIKEKKPEKICSQYGLQRSSKQVDRRSNTFQFVKYFCCREEPGRRRERIYRRFSVRGVGYINTQVVSATISRTHSEVHTSVLTVMLPP